MATKNEQHRTSPIYIESGYCIHLQG